MWVYVLLGALGGVVLGHIIPPGYLFWFFTGGILVYGIEKYTRNFR